MTTQPSSKTFSRMTIPRITSMKGREPLVCLTAYTTPMAKIVDQYCDIVLVGDSVGMVLYGMDQTLGVSVEMMIAHGQAVCRGAKRSCVIVDMPFGSYEKSPQDAFENAARIMSETQCQGVKLEGGKEISQTVAFLVNRGIPVLGHVGLMPQKVHCEGGFVVKGHDKNFHKKIQDDVKALEEAGIFSLVIEGVVEPLAREITENCLVPTIGIGASPHCDGQILVTEDLLGLFSDFQPKFVKRYAQLDQQIHDAVENYAKEVRLRDFPSSQYCFAVKNKANSS